MDSSRVGSIARTVALAIGCAALSTPAASVAAAPAGPLSSPFARPRAGLRQPAISLAGSVRPAGSPLAHPFHCQLPAAEFHCYTPHQLRAAYGTNGLLRNGHDGAGRTIVVIDAFQDPTIGRDLAMFDERMEIPAPPAFEIVAPAGITPFNPSNENQVGWAGEVALDVEWAHAIAPAARIVLALSPSDDESDLIATEQYVIGHRLGDVVSMSYMGAEQCSQAKLVSEEREAFAEAGEAGITLLASSGDSGATQLNCEANGLLGERAVGIPSTDPYVTAVGGTDLLASHITGRYISESVWDEPENQEGGGGGYSVLFAEPHYQETAQQTGARGVPDVSYSASARNGAVVAWGSSGEENEFWIFSGTSLGSPQWAGLVAIADQMAGRSLGNVNPALYAIGAGAHYTHSFNDVTTGENGMPPVPGYPAAPGWDPATGLGTPKARMLIRELAAAKVGSAEESRSALRTRAGGPRSSRRHPAVQLAHR